MPPANPLISANNHVNATSNSTMKNLRPEILMVNGSGRHSRSGGEAPWCAWQESNLLPLAPQASALSGELQAHGRKAQFRRGSIAAVAAVNVVRSRLLTTTSATNTERCPHANRTEGRSYVNELMPSPVLVPRVRPGTTAPGAGGANPKMPDCHARSACPSSPKLATKLETPLTLVIAPSSVLHAGELAVKVEMAPAVAPCNCKRVHSPVSRVASVGSAPWSTDR